MKKRDLIPLWNALSFANSLRSTDRAVVSAKFAYGINKNKRMIKGEIDDIESAQNLFMKDKVKDIDDLKKKHSQKDKRGEMVIYTDDSGLRKIAGLEGNADYIREIEEVNEKYKDKQADFEKLLDEDAQKYIFHKIKFDMFPDVFSGEDIELLSPIIDEG